MNKCKRNKSAVLFCLSLIFCSLFILTANGHCEAWRILSKNHQRGSLVDQSLQVKNAPVVKPWSDSILWNSLLTTKSHASFSVKINDKLPEFNFKIAGKMKGEYFHPSHVEITNSSNGKIIQKLTAKNCFDNKGHGWNNIDSFVADLIQVADLNDDGYLDLRILIWAGATGNNG